MSIISSQHLADETNSSGDGGKVSGKSYRSGAWVDHAWPTNVIDSQYPRGWVSGGWDEIKIVFFDVFCDERERRIRDMG